MYPVALTGGIGSGKTTVATLFKTLHSIDIICADQCAKEVILLPEVTDSIVEKFGNQIANSEGVIDRKRLRNTMSEDPSARVWLNNLMHPIIRQHLELKLTRSQSIYTIMDIPLLTKKSLINYPYLKKIITVCALLETKVARIIKRDNQMKSQALALIQSQITDNERRQFSDFIIDNNADVASLIPKVNQIDQIIRSIIAKR